MSKPIIGKLSVPNHRHCDCGAVLIQIRKKVAYAKHCRLLPNYQCPECGDFIYHRKSVR